MSQAKSQRVGRCGGSQFIHEGLACKVVGRCGKASIRALTQGRVGTFGRDAAIGDLVGRIDGCAACVDICELGYAVDSPTPKM